MLHAVSDVSKTDACLFLSVHPIFPTRVMADGGDESPTLSFTLPVKVYYPNPRKTYSTVFINRRVDQSLLNSFLLGVCYSSTAARSFVAIIRMEDPGEECEIEAYYTSSGEEECKSKVTWILNRGLQLGKKIVIAGVVMSSAPLVLPPLVVLSAFGFAILLPFGVVYATYACTEKLMNKLLSLSASSPILEYETRVMDDEEVEEESELRGEYLQEQELEKQIEDIKEEVEMRTELVEDGKEEQGDDCLVNIEEVEQEKLYKDGSFKEKGHEEDVSEYLEGEDEVSLGGGNIKIEGVEKEIDKEPLTEEIKNENTSPEVKQVVVVTAGEKKNANDVTKTDDLVVVAGGVQSDIRDVEKEKVTSNEKDVELNEGTTGLLEKISDKRDGDESAKKNKKKNKHRGKKSHEAGENKEDKHGKSAKEMDEKLNKQLGGKGDETIPDAKTESTKSTAEGSMTGNVVANDTSSVLASPKTVGCQGTLNNGKHAAENCKIVKVEPKPGTATQGSRVDASVSDEKEVNSFGLKAERSEITEKSISEKKLDVLENQVQEEDSPISSNEISFSEGKI